MIKKNNKGFTLLELLISIFILTTVIFLGYKVINKSTMYIKNQSNIHKGQLTVNNMNDYLTKDLERASSIVLIVDNKKVIDTSLEENSTEEQQTILSKLSKDQLEKSLENISSTHEEFNYSYNIRFREDENSENDDYSRIYSVEINKDDKGNYRYSVSREETDGVSISFIIDEILKEKELPFAIDGNSPYKVFLAYNSKNNEFEKYEFTVTSRLYETNGNTNSSEDGGGNSPGEDGGGNSPGTGDNGNNIIPPDIPQEIIPEMPEIPEDIDDKNYLCMGYWMMDTSKYNPQKHKGDLYTWIEKKGAYGKQEDNTKEFYIKGDNDNGNSSKSNAYMRDYEYSKNLIHVNNNSIPANKVKKIKIYVSPYTTVKQTKVKLDHSDFKGITDIKTNTELRPEGGTYTLQGNEEGRWYEINFEYKNGSNKTNFIIDGMLSIDKFKKTSGYALIVYGDAANQNGETINGEIVYKWQKGDNNDYNVKAYSTVGSDTNERNQTQHNNLRNMSIQIDKGSTPPIIRARGIDQEITTSDIKFSNIKAIRLEIEGKLVLSDIYFNNQYIGSLDSNNSYKRLDLNNTQMSNELRANFNFNNMQQRGDTGNLIIKFIY